DEIRDDFYLSPAHKWIDKAGTAVLRLVDSLSEYLAYKQYLDVQSPSSRAYLRDLFLELSDGDVVITLNWDAAADRVCSLSGAGVHETDTDFRSDCSENSRRTQRTCRLEYLNRRTFCS